MILGYSLSREAGMVDGRSNPEAWTPRHVPWCTLLLLSATLAMSLHAWIEVSGSWFGRVRIFQLEPWGLRLEHLRELEFWRLLSAQLVHVRQGHLPLSALCMLWLGSGVERRLGPVRLFVLWLVAGSLATLVSTLFSQPPWNLGTGASQAIMAFAGAGLWLARANGDRSGRLLWAIGFTIASTFALDLVFAHYPKPGHIAGLVLGFAMTAIFDLIRRSSRP